MSRRSTGLDRTGAVPRSILILLLVAIVAVGGLWLAKKTHTTDVNLGGALFPVAPEHIDGLLLTKGKLQYRFNRQPDGSWTLSGAANDYLDPGAMLSLIAVLPVAIGGPILPGTEPEDRRYNFNGLESIRLRVFSDDGREFSLALGALNPVTGNYYASGVDRLGCFPVAGPFRDKLFMLPATVQSKRLLPAFDRDLVQHVKLIRSGREHRFARFQDKWWLLRSGADLPAALAGLPVGVRDYQAIYSDRRRQDDEGIWIMASDQAVGQLIYEVSSVIVRDIKNPREAASRMQQWELDPPWRQIILQGKGLNPDPTAPVTDQFTLAFGPPLVENRAPALRRGNVLLVDFEAVNLLEEGLESLVEQTALNIAARSADRFRLAREGQLLLDAARTGEALTDEGRTSWQTVVPGPNQNKMTEKIRHGMSQDLIVNLNRLDVLATLPPQTNAAVLASRERVRIVLNWETGAAPHELVFEAGFLVTDQLGTAAASVVRSPDGGPAVGLWFPATGRLLQVSNQLIVTTRTLEPLTRP